MRLLDKKLNVVVEKVRNTYTDAIKLAIAYGARYKLEDEPPTIVENRIVLSTKSKKHPVIHIVTVKE